MKHYLVTGGSGFIGSAFVKDLVRRGYKVRVLDSHLRGSPERLKEVLNDIELISGDIRDQDIVKKACEGIDSVCHLAYVNGTEYFYSKPELVLEIAVKGMIHVLDACRKHGVSELILASSSEVYQRPSQIPTPEEVSYLIPDPLNPRFSYAGGKIISELMAIHYGQKYFKRVLIFRPHNVYGPQMGYEHVIPQFIVRMKKLSEEGESKIHFPIQGTGDQTRSFIYIDDFIRALALLFEKGDHLGIYHVGTMDEISIRQVAFAMADYFGKEIILVPGEEAKGGTERRCPDISKLRKLGFEPKISFKEGLKQTIDWYLREGNLS